MAYLVSEPLRTLDANTFNGSYNPIGTPLAYDALLIKIYNGTNQGVLISMDGVNNTAFIDSGQVWDLVCSPGANAIQAGTQLYISGLSDLYNQGLVYLSVLHD